MNNTKTSSDRVPSNLDGDKFVMAVLRPELIMRFTTKKMREYKDAKEVKVNNEDAADKNGTKEGEGTKKSTVAAEGDLEDLKTLRLNINVVLLHLKCIEDVDKDAFEQLKKNEEFTAEIAKYLWDSVLPQITREVRETPSQIPVDRKKFTEFLHERGVNCRYLGRLALMALEEEDSDSEEENNFVNGKVKEIKWRTIHQSWLKQLHHNLL